MKTRAYTLIELLIVISIMGILIALGSFTWASVSARSRDNTRKTDLQHIQTVLGQYYADQRSYPAFDPTPFATTPGSTKVVFDAAWQLSSNSLLACQHPSSNPTFSPNYMSTIPDDPKQSKDFTKSACTDTDLTNTPQINRYVYAENTNSNYILMAALENKKDPDRIPVSLGTPAEIDAGLVLNYTIKGGSSR